MKQLKYDTADNVLRIDYPEEWTIADLTAITATIKNTASIELLAASAVTMYPATTSDGGISRYTDQIVLAAGATTPDPGDILTLVGAGGSETVRVKGYDPSTLTVTTEEPVENQYDDGDAIYGNFGNITVDTTDTDTFQLGLNVQVLWTPAGTGTVTKDLYDIARFAMDLVSLRGRFQRLYPRSFKAFTVPTDRFSDMVTEAEEEVKVKMEVARMNYDRIAGQSITIQLIMAMMAYMWTFEGDDEIADEREFLQSRYNTKFAEVKALPIWQDTNQDDVKDDNEVQTHQHIFGRHW
ncbi:hypothetical protein KAR91_53360 [Candidatus Pacearchaeota archaeon]|nr:hypothetical protein [Candidatus Pacearchaeota archaeon]